MTKKLHILLTGASGYLGQHLLSHWMTQGPPEGYFYEITALYHRLESFPLAVQQLQAPNTSSNDVKVTIHSCNLAANNIVLPLDLSLVDICIHTAAISSPRACQADPETARAMNVPKNFLSRLKDVPIIALSTDQVYDGTKDTTKDGYYKEASDSPNPLNIYGQTKWELEQYLKQQQHSGVALRSSIILGPKGPFGKAHDTFLQFCASRNQQETTFYTNEYRTVVSVQHVCRIVDWKIHNHPKSSFEVYHLGGPLRLNRLDMAMAVFEHLGFDTKYLVATEQNASTVPLDISMDSTALEKLTGIAHKPATLKELVAYTLSEP